MWSETGWVNCPDNGWGWERGRGVKDRSFWCVTCVPPPPFVVAGAAGLVGRPTVYTTKESACWEFIDRASGRDRLQRIAAGCFYALAAVAHNASTPKIQNTPFLLYSRAPCVAFFVPLRSSPSRWSTIKMHCRVHNNLIYRSVVFLNFGITPLGLIRFVLRRFRGQIRQYFDIQMTII